jgi:aminoglycoside phosphotransferase (APT) family kinase protein
VADEQVAVNRPMPASRGFPSRVRMAGMRAISLPAVPYDTVGARPDWADLPSEVRAAVADRLGSPVVESATARGGFTRGFAAVLTTAAGERAFVKAARLADQPHIADWYAREAALTAALPAGVPAPRPRWTMTVAAYFVVCLAAIDGRLPALPWRPDELAATLDAWATAATALRTPPPALLAIGLPSLAALARSDLSEWQEIAAGREPMPPALGLAAKRLPELAALEASFPGYAERAGGVLHCDLRLDNILIDSSGRAWICDWNWMCVGPAWFDTAGLLVTAFASGLDADALFAAHPTSDDCPPEGLDAALATLSGFWLSRAAAGPGDAAPHVQVHQRWSGEVALGWLADRRRWA